MILKLYILCDYHFGLLSLYEIFIKINEIVKIEMRSTNVDANKRNSILSTIVEALWIQ